MGGHFLNDRRQCIVPCRHIYLLFLSLNESWQSYEGVMARILTGWLQSVGSIKLQVSFAEYRLFYRALLQKRRSHLIHHVAYKVTTQLSRRYSIYYIQFTTCDLLHTIAISRAVLQHVHFLESLFVTQFAVCIDF